MTKTNINTEDKILQSSCKIFVLYGYHATTLQQIATSAGVNKSSIHYYFRSKEKLYRVVVQLIIDLILNTEFDLSSNRKSMEKPTWFLFTELYNNRILFEHAIKELHPDDWDGILKDLNSWLEFSNSPLS